jgi:methionyl-tRNA formyltransferase
MSEYNFQNKKIAFFGTPDFVVEFLELFKTLNLNLELIVTGEDKPFGRGMQMKSPAAKKFANENKIKVLQPKKLSEIENELNDFDLFIVIAYGKIMPERIINLAKHGTINLHYSLLPKYRGASPVETAILNGDTKTGITIQQMVYKLDEGDILYQEKIDILETETTSELRNRLNKRAIEIFPEFLEEFFQGKIPPHSQDNSLATTCGKFSKLDFDVTTDLKTNNFDLVYKKFKAFDKRIYFFHATPPNPLSKEGGHQLRIKITDMDSTQILKVIPESRKEISYKDFNNSFKN